MIVIGVFQPVVTIITALVNSKLLMSFTFYLLLQHQAVGIVGAVIMPHNMYLHSALVKVDLVTPLIFQFLSRNLLVKEFPRIMQKNTVKQRIIYGEAEKSLIPSPPKSSVLIKRMIFLIVYKTFLIALYSCSLFFAIIY